MAKKKILFVCLGNICRSPSAEAVFTGIVNANKLTEMYEIDSAGIGSWYIGKPADKRMQKHALRRGFHLTSTARQFNPDTDFDRFDMIVAMDDENVADLKQRARSQKDIEKIHKITDFRKEWGYTEVPDPYYGGDEGFELVLDLLEDACQGLLDATRY